LGKPVKKQVESGGLSAKEGGKAKKCMPNKHSLNAQKIQNGKYVILSCQFWKVRENILYC